MAFRLDDAVRILRSTPRVYAALLGDTSQVARALAGQYRGDVGPWTAYMSILEAPKP